MSYQNITLAELQALVSGRFDSPLFWSTGEQTTAINAALSMFQLATGRWRNRYVVTTVAARCFYSIPDLPQLQSGGICQVFQPIRASFNGANPLGWTSFADMDLTYPGWQIQTTATAGAPSIPTLCGAAGVNLFWLWPADAVGNNSLQLDCVTNAPQLVLPDDFIDLDTTEVVGILDFAQCWLSFKRGGVFFQRTIPLFKSFLAMCANRNSYLVNLDIFRSLIGADLARNYFPRRQSERSGRPVGVGNR